MDINAEELMRRYELLDQEPVLEYSSLETEADNENPPINIINTFYNYRHRLFISPPTVHPRAGQILQF